MESRVGWLRGATFAHRGFHDTTGSGAKGRMTGWVENSASAIAGAVRFGYGVECDVQISADGVAMVFHDATLGRLTHVQGAVADHAAAVLTRDDQAGLVHELAGDTSYTLAEFAAEVGRQTGRAIPYVNLPEADYRGALLGAGLPEPIAQLLADSDVGASKGGLFDDGHRLSQLTGRPTATLAAMVEAALR